MATEEKLYDVIVIGGGASGMMAALVAAERGKNVLILEKNASLGEKLKITGGGRCNITNAEDDVHALLRNYGAAKDFLFSAFSQFGVKDTFAFFESRGLPLVVQARKRAFPRTERALDVSATLKKSLDAANVDYALSCEVKKIIHANGAVEGVRTSKGILKADSYILATGGMSHPETGSTGDGFKWLEDLGHTVKAATPTIVPLAVEDAWVKMLAGTSLSFMKISFYLEEKRQFSKVGKVLFTHFGLSGPLILNSATKVAELLEAGPVRASIDAFPDTDLGALDDRVVKVFEEHKNKALKNVLKEIVPLGTTEAIRTLLAEIDFETKVHSITKDERKQLVHLLKALPIRITHLMGYDRAVVADGGVALEEIDTRTMRSKILKNLYITGDLLHINRPSGGFSLQLCWTTGFVAGNAA
ncbi:MAG: hypothetical protein A2542_00205 [Parcubacteria group bacterium RIFOXYD2_FULL_52_8]|nr:MAG: hypothetical protein A2542_00205 [Parcubacteria group bacterium RIFOXYD2_FULL_52_8]